MKVKAIVPFAFYDATLGHVNVDEGAEANIDDAEAKRLQEAGIVEFVRSSKIETSSLPKEGIETTSDGELHVSPAEGTA